MNSRNFIISVAVAISFFAACFAWETRCALSGDVGVEISVGACMTGSCAEDLPNACKSTPEKPCMPLIELNAFYTLPCGCIEEIAVLQRGCSSLQGRTGCLSQTGKKLIPYQDGSAVLDIEEGGCGDFSSFSCKVRVIGGIPINHENCPNGYPDYPYLIGEFDCVKDISKPVIIRQCGDLQNAKGC